mmetsp:Transcript_5595/g.11500  ORF Transcript_5595/g.11500 Transcript_5595/m.11500 type:complete len:958 (-) Transcript_5595:109-2982(-)
MKRVMKRALADRAKLDLPATGVASPPAESPAPNSGMSPALQNGVIGHISSPSASQPPLKVPRLASDNSSSLRVEQTSSMLSPPQPSGLEQDRSGATVRPSSVPTSPRPAMGSRSGNHTTPSSNKRPRPSQQQTEEEEDNGSAFYLKHQNRALAIELKSLQSQVRDLTREREYRRRSCLQAVQALHSLQATWTSLETALGQEAAPVPLLPSSPGGTMPSSTVGNTDETGVEWTIALHKALQALGSNRANNSLVKMEDGADSSFGNSPPSSPSLQGEMKLGELAANVTGRATCLQEWLWDLLRAKSTRLPAPVPSGEMSNGNSLDENHAGLISETEQLKNQLMEVTTSRDDYATRERRLRRNIYRLDVGMISQSQLIQSVIGNADEGSDDPERLAVQKEAILKGSANPAIAPDPVNSQETAPSGDGTTKPDAATFSLSSKAVLDLQRELDESRQAVSNRDKSIEEMSSRIRHLETRVTSLSIKQLSDGDKGKLEAFESMSLKLDASEKRANDLSEKLDNARDKWAQCAGNEKAAMNSLDDLQDKHQRKWSELASSVDAKEENGDITRGEQQAIKVAELEHKLCQALENVRQAETARNNLRDALAMNETLQANLAEMKARVSAAEKPEKNEALVSKSGDNHATPSSSRSESRHHHREREREREAGSERISSEKAEKLYRENKKMRKEMASLIASKEGHKARLERVEKERNALAEVNVRLMKQVTEKDEMNAKSLSSILHLKGLTEQLTQERKNLEEEVKSAEQLALAARLANNAKERLAEELAKEKSSLEDEMRELEKVHLETKKELSQKIADCADASGKTSTLHAELSNALKRCDEFVSQTEEQGGEIRKLLDALDKAERTARESREKLAEIAKNTPSSSSTPSSTGFTADQMKTQVDFLKKRLACPVCHYRDKECIIMRCRHMHCKQCVEDRLSNRSRKCPTCNIPFGRSDVEDIFLG